MPKHPYTPDEAAFWRSPAYVIMAAFYVLLGATAMLVFGVAFETAACLVPGQ